MKMTEKEKQRNQRELILLIGVLSVVAVILIGIGTYVVLNSWNEENMSYVERIQLAEKYASKGNYTEAVRIYWDAIDLNENDEQAYLGLGATYEEIGEMSNAETVYLIGLQRIQSENLQMRLERLELAEEKEGFAAAVAINDSLLRNLSKMTFEIGQQKYGAAKIDTSQKDVYKVTYPNLGAVFYYYNTASDSKVLDISTKQPYGNKQPNEIKLDDLILLFSGMEDTMTYDALQEYQLTGLKKERDVQLKKYVVRFTMEGCEVVIETDENGTIQSRSAWNRLYPQEYAGAETIAGGHALCGRVINAATGKPVGDVRIEIYEPNDRSEILAECSSDRDGYYVCEGLESGMYTAHIQAQEFIEEDIEVQVYEWDNDSEQDLMISPELAAGEIRLVLSWGSFPRDLDSYLFGSSSDGTTIKVCYYDQVASGDSGTIAELDVDCMSGYGPETTTIHDTKGEYRFVVADFNRTGTMASSGAEVKIYVGDSAPITVSVASDVVDQWEVCTIKNGEVSVSNRPANEGWSSGSK